MYLLLFSPFSSALPPPSLCLSLSFWIMLFLFPSFPALSNRKESWFRLHKINGIKASALLSGEWSFYSIRSLLQFVSSLSHSLPSSSSNLFLFCYIFFWMQVSMSFSKHHFIIIRFVQNCKDLSLISIAIWIMQQYTPHVIP